MHPLALRATLGAVVAAAFCVTTPAGASCAGTVAEVPHLETKADGRVVVQGFGGGSFCDSGTVASVCLDANVATRSASCRTYTGTFATGETGEEACSIGVWSTQVVVIPGTGAPSTTHSGPRLVVTDCGVASTR